MQVSVIIFSFFNIKKIKGNYFLLIFLLLIFNNLYTKSIREKTENLIKKTFKNKTIEIIYHGKIQIPKDTKSIIENKIKQKFYLDYIFVWSVVDSIKKINISYALLDHVLGKVKPITFVVILNTQGEIIKSKVIVYREEYGGAIRSEKWNRQFIGKNNRDEFRINQNISGISGATISVNSFSKGIQKLLYLFPELNLN